MPRKPYRRYPPAVEHKLVWLVIVLLAAVLLAAYAIRHV